MRYRENKDCYTDLITKYLNGESTVQAFDIQFTALWRQDRDEEWELVQNTGRPDLQLIDKFTTGQISQEQYRESWKQLFRKNDEKEQRLREILDQIFSALDVYTETPELPYEINESELKETVFALNEQLNALY